MYCRKAIALFRLFEKSNNLKIGHSNKHTSAYDHSQETGNPHNTQTADINGLQAALDSKANAEKTLTYKGMIPIDGDYNYTITGIYVPQDAETCTNAPSVKHGKLEVVVDELNMAD